jgi:SAM-dependent methyltransferase
MSPSADDAVQAHEIEWTDRQVSRLWDYYARTPPYSEMYFARRFGRLLLRDSALPLAQPLEVLDFGCGPGFIWDHLQDLGAAWQYTALDFSPRSVAALRERAAGHARFRTAIHATELPTELATSAFDAVLLLEVVEHLKDAYLDATLREAARVLKAGGVLVISTPNEENLALSRHFCPSCGAIYHPWQHVRSWSLASLEHCLSAYGFTLVRHRATDLEAREGTLASRLHAAKGVVKGALGLGRPYPHLLTVFQKK